MPIQWYPGHMTKARREIAEAIPRHDVVIEVLDARMPRASENPLLAELRGKKPCLKVLSKSDLADPDVTAAWLRAFETRYPQPSESSTDGPNGEVLAIALSSSRAQDVRARIPELCKRLAPRRSTPSKVVRAMIVGIPNVGKSTLINTLMERKVAKVGDEPAVTKARQLAIMKSGMQLSDHPGIMWPKIEDEASSYCLAFGGAIPDAALDYESVALFGARVLLDRYPERLRARYKIEELPDTPYALLEEIGRRRGGLRPGGVIDLHKAGDALIHDFRTGALGRISLETPDALLSV